MRELERGGFSCSSRKYHRQETYASGGDRSQHSTGIPRKAKHEGTRDQRIKGHTSRTRKKHSSKLHVINPSHFLSREAKMAKDPEVLSGTA